MIFQIIWPENWAIFRFRSDKKPFPLLDIAVLHDRLSFFRALLISLDHGSDDTAALTRRFSRVAGSEDEVHAI